MDTEFWRRYQPSRLDEIPMDETAREQLEGYLERGTPPDLLLTGPDEAEVNRVARVFAKGFDSHILYASSVGGAAGSVSLERIRNQLRLTCGGLAQASWRLVVLEHAHKLSNGAADTLGRLLQSNQRSACGRLIATARSAAEIPFPLRSSLMQASVPKPPPEERERVLKQVLARMEIVAEPQELRPWTRLGIPVPEVLRRMESAWLRTGTVGPDLGRDRTVVSLREFLGRSTYEENVPWEFAPLLARNRLTILFGRPGVAGKSTFSRHLAAAKTQGRDFLEEELERGRVLWISPSGEEVRDDIARSLSALDTNLDNLLMWDEVTPDVEDVARTCAAHSIHIVVLDRLSKFAGITEEASNDQWSRWSDRALPVIRQSGAAWLAIHQARKAPGGDARGVRGASEIVALADVVARLSRFRYQRHDHRNRRTLYVEGSRYGFPPAIHYDLTEENHFERVEPAVSTDGAGKRGRDAVLEAVGSDWINRTTIEDRLDEAGYAVSGTTVHRRLNELVDDGELDREGAGVSGDPHRWRRVDAADDDA